MRSVVFRFESVAAFSVALEETTGSLPMPDGESVRDGEWVLATFEIGSRRRATAAAARGVRAAGDVHLEFERRDWDRLLAFVAVRSEHVRAAKPVIVDPVLPPVEPDRESGPPISTPPPSSALESSRFAGASVLLVEDDDSTRSELSDMLTAIGLVVVFARGAADAEARTREQTFDAIVIDFHVAGADALTFVRELRRDPVLAPTPVLMLASAKSSREAVDAFASGADDFLAKPFRTPELGARLFGLLRRARLARAASFGGAR